MYELTCQDYQKKYIGKTGCTFKTCYKVQVQAIRTNKSISNCAQHILDNKHLYRSVGNTMKILHLATKGKHMNTHEKFCIYQLSERYSTERSSFRLH